MIYRQLPATTNRVISKKLRNPLPGITAWANLSESHPLRCGKPDKFPIFSILGIAIRFLVVGRGLAVTGFEALGEIGGGGETGLVHYLGDGVPALLQKGGGGLQTDVADELCRTQAGELLDLTVDLLGGPVGFFAEGGG